MGPDYRIKWDYLDENVLSTLDTLGVLRHDTGISFSRSLSKNDLFIVFSYLTSVARNTNQADDNHIILAIGDCLNEVSKTCGPAEVDAFTGSAAKLLKLRDQLINASGGALIYLQYLERTILLCCTLLKRKGVNISAADLLSGDPKTCRTTLGQIKDGLIKTKSFSLEFEQRFEAFVEARNRFIHRLWIEDIEPYPTENRLIQMKLFLFNLVTEAKMIEPVFKGLYALAVETKHARGSKLEASDLSPHWSAYIPIFESALREPGLE